MSSVPSPRDLQRYFIPKYGTHWREIGIDLGLSYATLDEIEADNPKSIRKCCSAMLAKWLSSNNEPSWKKIFCAIEVVPRVFQQPDKGKIELQICSVYIYIYIYIYVGRKRLKHC